MVARPSSARQRRESSVHSRTAVRHTYPVEATTHNVPSPSLDELVQQLRASIAPDLYKPGAFLRQGEADQRLAELADELEHMQQVIDRGSRPDELALALRARPRIVEVLQLLFVAPNGAGFADGRELPERPTDDPAVLEGLSTLAIDLGLGWLAPPGTDVNHLARLGIVAVDARRRGYRRRDSIEERTGELIDQAVEEVRALRGLDVQLLPQAAFPPQARGRARAVVAVDGAPVAAVATVLQTQSGGRQQRDLVITYPQLQADLDSLPCSLLLIVDGRGVAEAGPRTLRTLIGSVGACLSLKQAEQGGLIDALSSAVVNRGARQANDVAIDSLIAAGLRDNPSIDTAALPVPEAAATLAIARYAVTHPDLALRLTDTGITWTDAERVGRAQRLADQPDLDSLTALLCDLLGLSEVSQVVDPTAPSDLRASCGSVPLDQVLPATLVVGASARRIDGDVVRAFARLTRRASAEASVAILVVAGARSWRATAAGRTLQGDLATSVVVIEPEELVAIAGAQSARDAIVRTVLEQADLTKANPFNTTGATPRQMFFGREEEEGRLRDLLTANSAALIGGRRIGKTSLLQATIESLQEEGWRPFYADCQEAGDWRTLAAHVAPRWGVTLDSEYRPSQLADLVAQLRKKTDKPVVVALDEIDALLRWDLQPRSGQVVESFFRACRALSQEGAAQFVFSGERTLAERLWDASSPHWNFCRPVPVKQLDRRAADELIVRPLSALGVAVVEPERFLDFTWQRTGGHPQVLQFLGDQLVRRLNDRAPSERVELDANDVRAVTETDRFRGHYLETYWGQAAELERLISALVVLGVTTVDELRVRLSSLGWRVDGRRLLAALRMLDLYGIVDTVESGVELRAGWLEEAMQAVGGARAVAGDSRLEAPGDADILQDRSSTAEPVALADGPASGNAG